MLLATRTEGRRSPNALLERAKTRPTRKRHLELIGDDYAIAEGTYTAVVIDAAVVDESVDVGAITQKNQAQTTSDTLATAIHQYLQVMREQEDVMMRQDYARQRGLPTLQSQSKHLQVWQKVLRRREKSPGVKGGFERLCISKYVNPSGMMRKVNEVVRVR